MIVNDINYHVRNIGATSKAGDPLPHLLDKAGISTTGISYVSGTRGFPGQVKRMGVYGKYFSTNFVAEYNVRPLARRVSEGLKSSSKGFCVGDAGPNDSNMARSSAVT